MAKFVLPAGSAALKACALVAALGGAAPAAHAAAALAMAPIDTLIDAAVDGEIVQKVSFAEPPTREEAVAPSAKLSPYTGARLDAFSYTCDGLPETMTERKAAERAGKIAREVMDGKERRITGDATHYHADYVDPYWNKVYPRTATVGTHIFYKQIPGA